MNKIHQIQIWLIKHTQDIVNMYNVEGHQEKALAYIAGGSSTAVRAIVHYDIVLKIDRRYLPQSGHNLASGAWKRRIVAPPSGQMTL